MSKVLTFSRTFPSYHPKKGQPTYFVEKLIRSFDPQLSFEQIANFGIKIGEIINYDIFKDAEPKHHTIRSGNRFKVGDMFSPRVWSGKPCASKQIIIAPDIEVKKVWDIKVSRIDTKIENSHYSSAAYYFTIDKKKVDIEQLAQNDGLSISELRDWFQLSNLLQKNRLKYTVFSGQIICWNENINY
jgi:hypothetical protein